MSTQPHDPSAVDRDFLRFRDHGDPSALAAVFDATAAELVRIARHLVHDAHAAEDLVQATFLSAIDAAPRFDPDRRVVPWLVGILTNHVCNHRRSVKRAPAPADATKEPAAPAADPVAHAADREFAAACDAALRGLPAPYGEVVRLTVGNGLRPIEVARTLRRPEGTVRSQLHRGMELLRQALPATTVAMAAVATGGTDLAAMRATVLARAATKAGATTAGAAGAAGLVWKLLAAAVLVVGLALGAYAAGLVGGADGTPGPDLTIARLELAAASVGSSAPAPVAPSAIGREPVAGTVLRTAQATGRAPGLHLAGTCRDERGGAVAGAVVEQWSFAVSAATWRRDPRATTGADGRFRFALSPDLEEQMFTVRATGRAVASLQLPPRDLVRPADGDVDVGQVTLVRGVLVHGAITPRPDGGTTRLDLLPVGDTPATGPFGVRIGGGAGRATFTGDAFTCDDLLRAGRYAVHVAGARAVRPAEVTVSDDADTFACDLAVDWWDTVPAIAGRVVDDAGVPVADARVGVRDPADAERWLAPGTRTDANGRFRIERGDATVAEIEVVARAPRTRPVPQRARWGARDLCVVVTSSPMVVLRVVDGESGAPIEQFVVQDDVVQAGPPVIALGETPRQHGGDVHRDGVVQMEALDLPRRVRIEPRGRRHMPSIVEIPPGQPLRLDVRLASRERCAVVVTLADGTPVRDAVVEELIVFGTADPANAPLDIAAALQMQDAVAVRAQATTNRSGRAVLSTAPTAAAVLAVAAPGHQRHIVDARALSPDRECRIELPAAATLRGRLTGAAFLKRLGAAKPDGMPQVYVSVNGEWTTAATVIWTEGNEPLWHEREHPSAPVAPDGSFALACPARAGVLWLRQGYWSGSLGATLPARRLAAVAAPGVGAGADLEFDATAFTLAALSVEATLGGEVPVSTAELTFQLSAPSAGSKYVMGSSLDHRGRTLLVLEPGEHDRLQLARMRWRPTPGGGTSGSPTGMIRLRVPAIRLEPGETRELAIDFPCARVTLRVLPEGDPRVENLWLRLIGEDETGTGVGCEPGAEFLCAPGLVRIEANVGANGAFVELARAQLAPGSAVRIDVPLP